MNFINIIIISIGVIVITFITIEFIKIFLNHKEYITSIEQLSNFNKKVIKWSEEIKDELIRHEYLHFCTNRIFNFDKITGETKTCLEEYNILKQEIIEKFVNHIPSLKQELREEKLNKILNGK
jgi:hypothetical protein